jgi:hypothetical protein
MPDEIGRLQEIENDRRDALIKKATENADIPVGTSGECENCGILSLRLVGGWCARCRDNENRKI